MLSINKLINKLNTMDKTCSAIILATYLLDQLTKLLIHKIYTFGELTTIIPGLFNIRYARNLGAAFSLLADSPEWFRKPFFIIVPLVAMVLVYLLLNKGEKLNKYERIGYSLVLGGALGNFTDRLTYGFVIDFLDIHWASSYHWPTFNVADIAITVAIFSLFLGFRVREKKEKEKKNKKKKIDKSKK